MESRQFNRYLDTFFNEYLSLNPILATIIGVHDYDHTFYNIWTDDYIRKIADLHSKYLEVFKRMKLTERDDLINYDCFRYNAIYYVEYINQPLKYFPIDQLNNIFITLENLVNSDKYPINTKEQLEDFRQRMSEFDKAFPSLLSRFIQGVGIRYALPKPIVEQIIFQLENIEKKKTYMKKNKNREFLEIMDRYYMKNLRHLIKFLQGWYLVKARTTLGICYLPNGQSLYKFLCKYYTNLDISPEALYELGTAEVDNDLIEIDELSLEINFDKKRNIPQSLEEGVAMYQLKKKEIEEKALTKYFGNLRPKNDYIIKGTDEKYGENAYYQIGSYNKNYQGTFYANLNNLDEHPEYMAEALTLHEGNPGHHFQMGIAVDIGIPKFRILSDYICYIEGWGLYSEELGIYNDKTSILGRLEMDLNRSLRLIVDVAINYYGWDYQRVFNFMKKIMPNRAESYIERSIYRYAVIPGQALAYKVGEIYIKDMRKKFILKYGNNNQVLRRFHRKFIKLGPVPIYLLDKYLLD